MALYQTLNPFTEELLEVFSTAKEAAIDAALDEARAAQIAWRTVSIAERANLLRQIASHLESQAESLARLAAIEMGKPLAEGVAEVRKCAATCVYYAEHGEELLAAVPQESSARRCEVRHEPLGVVFAIMPWNFPFWQVLRFAAPTLMAGNAVLLKHAPNVPQCTLAITKLIRDAGAAKGLFQALFLTNEQAAKVIADRRIDAVTFTGSTAAGRIVAAEAGRTLKPAVLELGGSDPFIVFPDVDIADVAQKAAAARCINGGQSCIASKRFLVHRSIYTVFREAFVTAMEKKALGDPLVEGVMLGPLARRDLRDKLSAQVQGIMGAGARCLTGGGVPAGKGFFYKPTVLEDVHADSAEAQQELFGPVAMLFTFGNDDEAVRLANATPYGLCASIWSGDIAHADAVSRRIDAGAVFINRAPASDPRFPFGGIKDSGFGRELGREGLISFVNKKSVVIDG